MKTLLFSFGLVFCVALLVLQHHQFSGQSERQSRAIALLQSKYDAAQLENRTLRISMQKKASYRAALVSAVPLAAGLQKTSPPPSAKRTVAR